MLEIFLAFWYIWIIFLLFAVYALFKHKLFGHMGESVVRYKLSKLDQNKYDYADFYSDINRMGRALAFDTSIDEFVLSLDSERESGTYNNYVSMDTQVLGMLLREATGQNLSEYMEEELWSKTGMEEDAYWLVDSQGMELAFGGLNALLRDYARFGLLYMNEGNYKGEQIVPASWVEDSVTPDSPHLMPGRLGDHQEELMGYGYQWWLPADTDGDYMAIGIYNQYI